MTVRLLVVGGGRMGEALVGGLVRAGWAPGDLAVAEPDPARREVLADLLPGVVLGAGPEVGSPGPEGGAVLAVKPDVVPAAARALARAGVPRVLSVAAGVATAALEAALGDGPAVIRAMPNAPALVGRGVTVISGGARATAADLDWAEGVLSGVGRVLRLPERHLDAVTGLSGSGPAYVALVAEALEEAGVLAGLPRDVARTLVVETLAGTAALLESGQEAGALRHAVTSPGGTTAAGLRALEARATRSAFLEAVLAATERARGLHR